MRDAFSDSMRSPMAYSTERKHIRSIPETGNFRRISLLLPSLEEKLMAKQPEALATFAATARNDGKKPKKIGLNATPDTKAIPTDSARKDEAARKVLREGVLGRDQGADAAIDGLPDRTRTNQGKRAK